MNSKEEQLEEISERVNNYKPIRNLPIFEHYITMVSIVLAVILFLFPDMFIEGNSGLYYILLSIMPQPIWAFTFFVSGMTKAVGLLADKNILRIIGLVMSAIIYSMFTFSYAMVFPNIGVVIFVFLALFSALSIPEVKKTGLRE